jgi:FkbM family methyltransferase
MPRKIFIDCGFYYGKGLRLFKETKEYDRDFVFYAFDPMTNPERCDIMKQENIILSHDIVWIHDGMIKFHKSSRYKGRANGVFSNSRAKNEDIEEMPCIDFGKWIMETFNKDDFIVLKMDIEGAEQDVLESMIKDGSIHYIDIGYIEFHNKRREGYNEMKHILKSLDSLDLRAPIERYKEMK